MKYLPLNADEAKSILDNQQTCLFLPVEFPYFVHHIVDGKPFAHRYKESKSAWALHDTNQSYPENLVDVGETIGVKEPWRAAKITIPGMTRIEYEAGGIKAIGDVVAVYDDDNWKSARKLPDEAIRTELRITDVSIKRIQDVTVEDILDLGLDVEMPPICKQQTNPNWPDDKEKAYFNKLSEIEREDYIRFRARATYIAWCEYADKLLAAFRRKWNLTVDRQYSLFLNYDANPYVWHIKFEKIQREEIRL